MNIWNLNAFDIVHLIVFPKSEKNKKKQLLQETKNKVKKVLITRTETK